MDVLAQIAGGKKLVVKSRDLVTRALFGDSACPLKHVEISVRRSTCFDTFDLADISAKLKVDFGFEERDDVGLGHMLKKDGLHVDLWSDVEVRSDFVLDRAFVSIPDMAIVDIPQHLVDVAQASWCVPIIAADRKDVPVLGDPTAWEAAYDVVEEGAPAMAPGWHEWAARGWCGAIKLR